MHAPCEVVVCMHAGGEVVELLAGARAEPGALGLLDALSPAMVQQVLRMEADTLVQDLRNKQGHV